MRHALARWLMSGALALAACKDAPGAPEVAPAPSPPLPKNAAAAVSATTRFVPLRTADNLHALEAAGRLLSPPNARAELTMPLAASILHVNVAHGQRVERGAVLAEVAVPEAARAAGRVEGARLRSDAYRARLDHLELLRSEGLARGAELADARARLAEAQADEHEALTVLQTVESAGLRRRGNRYEVVSPLAGVVIETNAPVGGVRGPSDGPVMTISGGSPTRVEARFAFLLPPNAAYQLVGPDESTAPLRLVSQAPEVMERDATRLAWFDADQPIALPQGTAVRVRMLPPRDAWVVPSTALVREGDRIEVRTRRAGLVAVELLAALGSEALVRGPLQAEDMVAEDRSPSRD